LSRDAEVRTNAAEVQSLGRVDSVSSDPSGPTSWAGGTRFASPPYPRSSISARHSAASMLAPGGAVESSLGTRAPTSAWPADSVYPLSAQSRFTRNTRSNQLGAL
jgi:hypothetical protein